MSGMRIVGNHRLPMLMRLSRGSASRRARVLAGLVTVGCALGFAGIAAAETCPNALRAAEAVEPAVRRGHAIRFRELLEGIDRRLETERYDVIVLGDSIMWQWPKESLEATFPGRSVLNAGVPGDGTAQLRFRLSGEETPAVVDGERVTIGVDGWARQSPEIVLIHIGTNDLTRLDACSIVGGIELLVAQARDLYPKARIIVSSILPRGATQQDEAGTIGMVNAEMRRRAGDAYTFVDTNAALTCAAGAECAYTRGQRDVHLNARGYRLFSAAIMQALAAEAR
jgi:lysophospholipase L1-like esterase